jgi:hypothetical protein
VKYFIRPFDTEGDYRSHEMRSLATMKQMIIEGSTLSNTQLQTLKSILEG